MYAVIESGGKQYKVAIGDRLKVESLKLDPGSSVDLEKVLLLADGDEVRVGSPYVGSKVEATVVGHGRGDKVRIFKLRRRKNSRTQAGHRQNYTELEIVSIDGKIAEPATKAAPASKAKPDSDDAEQKEAAPAPKAVEDKAGDSAVADAAPAPSDDEVAPGDEEAVKAPE
jgi:large subunit ribosomal protein L21